MWSFGNVLIRLILVSAVLLTVEFAVAGVYPLAVGLGVLLLAYGYLVLWGDRCIEERLLPPHR
ncbi:MAG TPA: hypothetical protein VFJ06_14370 [Halococcus sp.]|nr:hypothetical protein [Halococcus sp.]